MEGETVTGIGLASRRLPKGRLGEITSVDRWILG